MTGTTLTIAETGLNRCNRGMILSHPDRIHLHGGEVQVQPVILDHTVAEHFPQDVAAELCQCGVDEQVLFFQCFGQRTF